MSMSLPKKALVIGLDGADPRVGARPDGRGRTAEPRGAPRARDLPAARLHAAARLRARLGELHDRPKPGRARRLRLRRGRGRDGGVRAGEPRGHPRDEALGRRVESGPTRRGDERAGHLPSAEGQRDIRLRDAHTAGPPVHEPGRGRGAHPGDRAGLSDRHRPGPLRRQGGASRPPPRTDRRAGESLPRPDDVHGVGPLPLRLHRDGPDPAPLLAGGKGRDPPLLPPDRRAHRHARQRRPGRCARDGPFRPRVRRHGPAFLRERLAPRGGLPPPPPRDGRSRRLRAAAVPRAGRREGDHQTSAAALRPDRRPPRNGRPAGHRLESHARIPLLRFEPRDQPEPRRAAAAGHRRPGRLRGRPR